MLDSKIRFVTSLILFSQLSPLKLAHAEGFLDRAKKAMGVTVTPDGKGGARVSLGQPGFLQGLAGEQPGAPAAAPSPARPSTRQQPIATAQPATGPLVAQPEEQAVQARTQKRIVVPSALTGAPAPTAEQPSAPVTEFEKAGGLRLVGVKTCDLTSVVWKNVTLRAGKQKREFEDGHAQLSPAERNHEHSYTLQSVAYGDIDQDGRIEAYLLISHEDRYATPAVERTEGYGELVAIDTTAACEPRVLGEFELGMSFYDAPSGAVVRDHYLASSASGRVVFGWKNGNFDELGRAEKKSGR